MGGLHTAGSLASLSTQISREGCLVGILVSKNPKMPTSPCVMRPFC
jgi:hypothetical protein